MANIITADQLSEIIVTFRDALIEHRDVINALNVYPVPDGDTGTNMSLTLQSVVEDLPDAGAPMAAVCKAISHGSLMGARGNSGVIMSQILRGLAAEITENETMDAPTFRRAVTAASTAAYGAVGNPVEGTILTVIREAAEAVSPELDLSDDLLAVLETCREGAAAALEKTPQLLPVLADAGVVDSGGTGLLLFFDAALHELDGRAIPAPVISDDAQVPTHTDVVDRPDAHDLSLIHI